MSGNKHIVLIMGQPNSGKSTSLMNMKNQDQMVYLNTDLKALPFADKFMKNIEVADAAVSTVISTVILYTQLNQAQKITPFWLMKKSFITNKLCSWNLECPLKVL